MERTIQISRTVAEIRRQLQDGTYVEPGAALYVDGVLADVFREADEAHAQARGSADQQEVDR